MHPKQFETVYVKREFIEQEIARMQLVMSDLDYKNLSDYDKGGLDGYNQAITEILKRLHSRVKKDIHS
jgi:hypothetical protein